VAVGIERLATATRHSDIRSAVHLVIGGQIAVGTRPTESDRGEGVCRIPCGVFGGTFCAIGSSLRLEFEGVDFLN